MLSFDLRDLESRAAVVADDLATDDPIWHDDDVLPAEGVHVEGRLSTAGKNRWYFSGALSGAVVEPCRRCLESTRVEVAHDLHLLYAEEGDETVEEDPDVYPVNARAHALDLRPAVREEWLLSAPAFVLCREDCKGLCPTCGTDLNTEACDCPPTTDSRWDALRSAEKASRSDA